MKKINSNSFICGILITSLTIKALFLFSSCTITYKSKKMRKITIYNKFNYVRQKGEKTVGKTMTVQGEAYSIKDLIQKNGSGINVDITRQEFYDDDPQHNDIDHNQAKDFDLVDKEEIRDKTKYLEKKIKDKKQAIAKQEKEAKAKKALPPDLETVHDESAAKEETKTKITESVQ